MGRPQVERRVRLEFPRRSGHPRHRVPEVTGMDKVFRESVKEGSQDPAVSNEIAKD